MRAASLAHHRTGVQPFTAAQPRSKYQHGTRAAAPVQARMGGGQGDDRRLIIPGQQQQQQGGRIVVPGQGGGVPPRQGGQLSGGGSGLVGIPGQPPPMQNFRPPPGFMNADGPAPEETGMSTEEMLSRINSLSGSWHQLAKLLPALQRAGVDAIAVEEFTGLERKTQNVWQTSAQVRSKGPVQAREVGGRCKGARREPRPSPAAPSLPACLLPSCARAARAHPSHCPLPPLHLAPCSPCPAGV